MERKVVIVEPADRLVGEVTPPGDKSISHRAVILGSIAEGSTRIHGFLPGEDNLRTVEAFRLMGVEIEKTDTTSLLIRGRGLYGLREPGDVIDAGNSGTTARLLTGLLSPQSFFAVITGDDSLRTRPMKRVVEPLAEMGAHIHGRDRGRYLPLAISGSALKGIYFRSPIPSAQVKSSILLAGLYADGTTVVEEPLRSRDHTERMLGVFGASVTVEGRRVGVKKAKSLRGCTVEVPGDISSASFLMVGAIITPDSELLIRNVGLNPTRTGVITILKRMGADIRIMNEEDRGEPCGDVVVRSSPLRGIEITHEEITSAIDEFPVICVAGAFAEGRTRISGAGELRVKESDRITAMAEGLRAIGVDAKEMDDGIEIQGVGCVDGVCGWVKGGRVRSHGDHRIAMAMAVAGLRAEEGVTIEGAECVDVSFPDFFDILSRVRI